MGLIDRARRQRYVVGFRLRYWWLDTTGGRRAHAGAFCVAVLLLLWEMVNMAVTAMFPSPPDEPVKAYWWIVQLVIAIVAAVIAYSLRPKPQQQAERQLDAPTVEDGTAVKDYGGTVWIDYEDNFLLAYKVVGRDAIRSKSGK